MGVPSSGVAWLSYPRRPPDGQRPFLYLGHAPPGPAHCAHPRTSFHRPPCGGAVSRSRARPFTQHKLRSLCSICWGGGCPPPPPPSQHAAGRNGCRLQSLDGGGTPGLRPRFRPRFPGTRPGWPFLFSRVDTEGRARCQSLTRGSARGSAHGSLSGIPSVSLRRKQGRCPRPLTPPRPGRFGGTVLPSAKRGGRDAPCDLGQRLPGAHSEAVPGLFHEGAHLSRLNS